MPTSRLEADDEPSAGYIVHDGCENATLRICVVDDHESTRLGVKTILEAQPGWKVVGEAADGDSAIKLVEDLKPDVLITDVQHPGPSGIEVASCAFRNVPGILILILTWTKSKLLVQAILEAGCRGYVMKSDAKRDLVTAIQAILNGKLFLQQTISEVLLGGFLEKPEPMRTENLLTKREIEVISLLARGKSNKEVAIELSISLRSAETHRANIMNKLQLHTVQDLVRYAVKHQLVEL